MSIVRQPFLNRTPGASPLHSTRVEPSLRRVSSCKRFRQSLKKQHCRRIHCANTSDQTIIKKLNAEELEVNIQDRSLPIIIDFYAMWCGPCVIMSQELEKVAAMMKNRVRIFKVDTDENPTLSSQLKIEALPTLVFLSSNPQKKSLRLEGVITAEDIIKIITENL